MVEERKCGDGGKVEARTGDGTCSRQPCGSAQSAGPSYKAVNPMPLDSYAVRQAHTLSRHSNVMCYLMSVAALKKVVNERSLDKAEQTKWDEMSTNG